MKRLVLILAALLFTGCNSTKIRRTSTDRNGTVHEVHFSHHRLPWGERQIDGLEIDGLADGSYSASLKGYQGEDTKGWEMANEAMRNSVSIALEALQSSRVPAQPVKPDLDALTVDGL